MVYRYRGVIILNCEYSSAPEHWYSNELYKQDDLYVNEVSVLNIYKENFFRELLYIYIRRMSYFAVRLLLFS